jgi:N-acyl-phosphatidylethanolamine-hydrolysing phospholipase D
MSSHHRPGGFRNPWPTAARVNAAGALFRWLVVERLAHPRALDPDPRTAFPRAEPTFEQPRAAPDALTATWVGHSTFLVQVGGWNVLTDPVWSERASPVTFVGPRRYTPPGVAFEALPPVDLVVLSHDHYDHLDAPTVRRLAHRFPDARWLAPLGVGALLRALGAAHVAECDWWQHTLCERAGAAPLEATCVPAQHFSGRGVTNRDATLWGGWVLRPRATAAATAAATGVPNAAAADAAAPGAAATNGAAPAVYFAGDTGLHPDFADVGRRCGPLALALLPIGAYAPRWFMRPVHCDPDDALAAYDAVCAGIAESHPGAEPPAFGASHFGTFRLTDEPTDEPPRRLRAEWAARGRGADAVWIPRHGETWRASGARSPAPARRPGRSG